MNVSALQAATDELAAYLSEVTAGDLGLPTPCEGWRVADLYEHLLHENLAFAAGVAGSGAAPLEAEWRVPGVPGLDGGGFDRSYRRTARTMLAAFAAVEAEEPREVAGVPGALPAGVLLEMQLCDTVIHTWDLARAIGLEFEPDAATAARVLRLMTALPDTARGEGGPFGAAVAPEDEGVDDFQRAIQLSGRRW
jgi:uncharacterized protein (TIGR03086 family)